MHVDSLSNISYVHWVVNSNLEDSLTVEFGVMGVFIKKNNIFESIESTPKAEKNKGGRMSFRSRNRGNLASFIFATDK